MSGPLPIRTVEKVWGVDRLPAPFATPEGKRIGEIWFEPPAALPDLLVKYLFTSEKLSIQCHPSDEQAAALGEPSGKEECWLVTAARPDATLGIGFDAPMSADAMRAAALDGSIEQAMTWHAVVPGDFFYIPAGTVHAIGPGVSLIEVQQNADITYRLYDYGRPRELHLERGMQVAKGEIYDRANLYRSVPERGFVRLVDGPKFCLARTDGDWRQGERGPAGPCLAIPVDGPVRVAGESVAAGGCALAENLETIRFDGDARCLIAWPA